MRDELRQRGYRVLPEQRLPLEERKQTECIDQRGPGTMHTRRSPRGPALWHDTRRRRALGDSHPGGTGGRNGARLILPFCDCSGFHKG